MGSDDPDAPAAPHVVLAGRKAWLVSRVYAVLLLGLWISYFSYMRHSVIGCLLGCLMILGSLILSYSKGSGFRHRYTPGQS